MSTRVSATVVTTATRVPPHRRAAKGSRSAVVASATRHGDGDDGRVDRAADVVVVGRRTALGMGASALMSASDFHAALEASRRKYQHGVSKVGALPRNRAI